MKPLVTWKAANPSIHRTKNTTATTHRRFIVLSSFGVMVMRSRRFGRFPIPPKVVDKHVALTVPARPLELSRHGPCVGRSSDGTLESVAGVRSDDGVLGDVPRIRCTARRGGEPGSRSRDSESRHRRS